MLQDGSLTPENAGEFPYFLNGDVAIAITNPAKTHIWRLHASILFNASDLLKEKLNPRDQSGIVRSTEGITTFLTLSNDEKPPQIPTLIARTLEEIPEQARRREQEAGPEDRRIPPAPASQATSIVSSVKTEGVGKQLTSHTPKFDAHVLSELCSAYDNLFRDIYGLPVLLQSESVHQSLFQAEVLVPIFRTYGQLASIRAQVENVFFPISEETIRSHHARSSPLAQPFHSPGELVHLYRGFRALSGLTQQFPSYQHKVEYPSCCPCPTQEER